MIDRQMIIGTSSAAVTMSSYAGYAVYKSGGNYSTPHYLGASDQTTYMDVGVSSVDNGGNGAYRPNWMPSTAPSSAGNDACIGTVASATGTKFFYCPLPKYGLQRDHLSR